MEEFSVRTTKLDANILREQLRQSKLAKRMGVDDPSEFDPVEPGEIKKFIYDEEMHKTAEEFYARQEEEETLKEQYRKELAAIRDEYDISKEDKETEMKHIIWKLLNLSSDEEKAIEIAEVYGMHVVPGDMVTWDGKEYPVTHKSIDRTKYSTPVVPNLGDSPTGGDIPKEDLSWWERLVGDSTKRMKRRAG